MLTILQKRKFTDMSMTRKGVKPEFMSSTDDGEKYYSSKVICKFSIGKRHWKKTSAQRFGDGTLKMGL